MSSDNPPKQLPGIRIRVVKPPTTGELLDEYFAKNGYRPTDGRTGISREGWRPRRTAPKPTT